MGTYTSSWMAGPSCSLRNHAAVDPPTPAPMMAMRAAEVLCAVMYAWAQQARQPRTNSSRRLQLGIAMYFLR